MLRSATVVLALFALGAPSVHAQSTTSSASKKVLTIDDYARWRTIDNGSLSPDGKWAAYGLRFANTVAPDAKPELRVRNLGTNDEVTIAHASQASFSPDSKWIAYLVEPPAPARARPGADSATTPATPPTTPPVPGPPTVAPATTPATGATRPPAPRRRWELRELATGKTVSWQDVQSAQFSPTSSHLMLRRRAAGASATGAPAGGAPGGGGAGAGGAGGGAAANGNAPRGVDVVLHDLNSGRSQFLGSVGDASFNRGGNVLAYTIDAAVRDGNGLYLVELTTGRTVVLDNDSLRYNRLAWNDRGTSLAVLKGREVERMRERNNRLVVFNNVASASGVAETTAAVLDPSTTVAFPKGVVLSDRAALSWSDDGARVYVSTIPQRALPDTGRRRSTDSLADVDIWRTQDERIISQQMIQLDADRNRTFRQAFDVASSRYIALTDSSMRDIEIPATGMWAVGRDARAYISDYKRPAADFYRVNLNTGERTLMFRGQLTGRNVNGISPDGSTFLFWKDRHWHAYDLAAGTTRAISTSASVNFTDMEEDHPGPRPPYGVMGYAHDGSGVIVQHRFDLWYLPLKSGAARNLTNGAGTRDKMVLRYVRTTPLDSSVRSGARVSREIDLTQPLTLSAYGEYTKKSGFYRMANGELRALVYDDASFSTPSRATASDVFLYTRQTFSEFPDLLVASGDFANPRKISEANPQHAEYRWGRRVLFDYTTRRGVKLQGVLAIPDDYVAGEKRPMLVTFYEKNSQTMHRYPTPSYITGMGAIPTEAVSRGYLTMLPDVHFHTGSSHSDMLDAVEAATRKVIAMGYADPRRIGVHGHSYGGEGAAFIGTRSKLFAAVGMGAGVTDLYSDFSQSWGWSYQVSGGSGANGNDYYLFGQGRWGFSPWDKPDVYRYESALTHAPSAASPFLIMHGTADPTVSFTESMNFYNALRYNGKNATMLAYPGEGHGLRGLANRRDLTIRYFQFFDHYLRGAAAPKWMTDGVPYIARDEVRGDPR